MNQKNVEKIKLWLKYLSLFNTLKRTKFDLASLLALDAFPQLRQSQQAMRCFLALLVIEDRLSKDDVLYWSI